MKLSKEMFNYNMSYLVGSWIILAPLFCSGYLLIGIHFKLILTLFISLLLFLVLNVFLKIPWKSFLTKIFPGIAIGTILAILTSHLMM